MAIALGLARRSLGAAWPNPAVGCVIVNDRGDGPIVAGRGCTAPGGRPHAETEALRRAGALAEGATAYVSLEPCAHHGETPPCAEALAKAGVSRVVVAVTDPDTRVSGAGIEYLRAAGIVVELGLLGDEASDVNAGFFTRVSDNRPLVTLKLATSLDGRIATATGDSQWITGERARAWSHGLRARNDAIAIGIGTALTDDPALSCRLPGLVARSPVRVVFDSALRLPHDSQLVTDAGSARLIVITAIGADQSRRAALEEMNVEVIEVDPDIDGRPDVAAAMQSLAHLGITRLLCEGGGQLAAALIAARVVDRVAWFRAPMLLGDDGLPSLEAFGVERVSDAPAFIRSGLQAVGKDTLESYRRPA